ncbi:MAG: PEP-CTERM sorting domain-containing protein, partial [Pirellulaceae bacterium]|nr:PEP-CTERM sorting domain-containing protein [Pirellulaceae bacterium]
ESNYVYLERSNQIAASAIVTFANDPDYSSRLNLLGNSQTVGGISCSDGRGVIQNTENESGISTDGVLTLNTMSDYSYNGYLRDRYQSGSTGKVAVAKTGAGTQTLSGANIRYTGGTTINGGRLVLEDTTNSSFLAAGITNNATLEFSTTAADVSHAGVISGTGSLVKSGSYALTLGGSTGNTFAGSTTVTAGSLYLNKSSGAAISGNLNIAGTGSNVYVQLSRAEQSANSSVVSLGNTANYARLYLNGYTETVGGIACTDGRGIIQSGNLIVAGSTNHSYNGYLRDDGGVNLSLAKQGTGTQTLSGPNITYTGGTTIGGGRLVLENTTNATFLAKSITNNAALEFNTTSASLAFTGSIGGTGAVTKSGSQTLTLSGPNIAYAGGTTINDGRLVLANTTNSAFLAKNIANNAALEFNTTSAAMNFTGSIAGTGSVTKNGAQTLTLSGANIAYVGGTTINAGKLVLRDTTHASFRATAVTNNATLEFDAATNDINFTGTISGTGAVQKTGSNRLTLGSASNSYAGTTTIVDGVLSASGTAVPGAIAIQPNGAFAPGDCVGSASTGAATWGGGRYLFDIADAGGTPGIDWDLWSVTGNMWISGLSSVAVTTLSGAVAGEMAGFDVKTPHSWLLAEATGFIYGFSNLGLDASGFENELDPGGYLHLSTAGNFKQIYLNYSLSMPGDANRDNRVDAADARLLAANWGKSGGWLDGDFNGDGIVNTLDASILAANWGYQAESGSPDQPVPEPTVPALLALGLLSLLARRRAR